MDLRKKACPNEFCKTHRKKKFNSKVNYCPECGEKLSMFVRHMAILNH